MAGSDRGVSRTKICVACGQTRFARGGGCLVCGSEFTRWRKEVEVLDMSKIKGLLGVLEVKRLVMSPHVGQWCLLPYPGHKRGCPNFGKKPGCPPDAVNIHRFIDISRPMYLVYSARFDLAGHAEKMKKYHPTWSARQCRNVLYWQGTVRAGLRRRVRAAMGYLACDAATYCPEGMGVNVFVTARLAGLRLDKTRHLSVDHHVALIGHSPE